MSERYKIVPREPTDEQKATINPTLDAIYNGTKDVTEIESGTTVYRAMWDASPDLDEQAVKVMARAIRKSHGMGVHTSYSDDARAALAALKTME